MTDEQLIEHFRRVSAEATKRQRIANPERFRATNKRYEEANPSYKVGRAAQAYVRSRVRADRCAQRFRDLVGCTLETFKAHLEAQFQPGMTWENRGYEGWHMDHKIPRCRFDLTDPDQLKECFHYTNFQPLWGKQNLRKWVGDDVEGGLTIRRAPGNKIAPARSLQLSGRGKLGELGKE